jgi:hypothetical protein
MDARYLVLLLLLISLSYSSCIGYNDTFQVRVLDGKLRPVQNAIVTVTYDRGTSFGDKYFTTQPRYTDQNGLVDMAIYNQGTTSRAIDCAITINGSIGGASKSVKVTANVHGSPVDVKLDVYPLRFFVRDQFGFPLANASVTLDNKTNRTGEDGSIAYTLAKGNHSYLANYLDASQDGTMPITGDSDFVVKFTFYRISVDVTDDSGNPLAATITILNKTLAISDGHFENEKTFGEAISYEVRYMGLESSGDIIPTKNPDAKVVFDIHSPVIMNITADALSDRPRLTMTISDPGPYGSGVDFSALEVIYRLEPADESTPWDNAVAFTTGRDKVTAEFPKLPADRVIRFRIDAKDKAGNKAEVEGKFTTFSAEAENATNITQNQTNTQGNQPQPQGLPLSYIVAGVIIIVLVVYLVIHIKSKAPNGG